MREIFGFRDSGEHGTFPEIIQISRLNDSEKAQRHNQSESDVRFPIRNEFPVECIMPTRLSMRGEVGRAPVRHGYPFQCGIAFES